MKRSKELSQSNIKFKIQKKNRNTEGNREIFKGLIFYILPSGLITKLRCTIFSEQIKKHCGKIETTISKKTSHVIVDDTLDWDKFSRISKWEDVEFNNNIVVARSEWLSKCLKNKNLYDVQPYELKPPPENVSTSVPVPIPEKIEKNTISEKPTSNFSELNVIGFACSKPSSHCVNFNKQITDKLEMMAETYKNTKDQWREYGYTKAINALKKYPKEIKTYKEAKSLPGVGDRLAQKIWEIIESGQFRKLEETKEDSQIQATNLFAQLWGAGPSTAKMWVKQGFRTLDDLKEKATLNKQQEIGLKHFHDFLEKMPRSEAAEIIDLVQKAALTIQSGLEVVGCGSFRRSRAFCGDIDILFTHLKEELQSQFLSKLVDKLHEIGLLTDDLTLPNHGNRSKYMGVCKLEGENKKFRRIDLFVVPSEEYATALLAYTGSGHFNRSMRLLARKKGMALSDQALTTGVIRKGAEKIHSGHRLETPTEKSIFDHLGLEFRIPEERDL